MAASAATAEVVLKANDGSIDVAGELVEFKDGIYVIQTAIGPLSMSASRVRCEGAECPVIKVDKADIRISGSETVGEELMPLILAGYASRFDAEADVTTGSEGFEKAVSLISEGGFGDEMVSFAIVSTGSESGLADLQSGQSEIAMSSRSVRPSEVKEFEAAGFGRLSDLAQERIVAVDSIRVIVSRENPVESISTDDLAAIYAGEITNWAQIGGPNAPINVYTRSEDTGTFDVIRTKLLRPRRKTLTPNATVVSGNIEMSKAVSADRAAIGFVGYAFERGAKSVALRTACGIEVKPEAFSAKTEEYPLQRRLYLYAGQNDLSEHAAGLFDYVATEDVDGLVAKAGFVDLGIKQRPHEETARRLRTDIDSSDDPYEQGVMRELFVDLQDWDRLSTTFRFASGSSVLDNKAQRDLSRIANFLKFRPGAKIAVVGFTDSEGAFGANLDLASRRAAQVAAEIRAAAGDSLDAANVEVKGYGELSPAACNSSFEGRKINRRVEIWLSKAS
ncbi:MAG: phosphate ABC transporter substrate-binding/OmpA family protein [Pseudomonadota bacterium]